MQTFLPYPSFYRSMATLDRKRLGNQVYREGKTLLDGGWPNHPVSKMWRGYECWLALYLLEGANVMKELRASWFSPGVPERWIDFYEDRLAGIEVNPNPPPWLGMHELHFSHQSNLIRKLPSWYRPIFGPDLPDDLPYFYPRESPNEPI